MVAIVSLLYVVVSLVTDVESDRVGIGFVKACRCIDSDDGGDRLAILLCDDGLRRTVTRKSSYSAD